MIFVRLAIGQDEQRPVAPQHVARVHVEDKPRARRSPRRTWKASTPESGTAGVGSASISGAGSRGASGAGATGGEPTASGGLAAPLARRRRRTTRAPRRRRRPAPRGSPGSRAAARRGERRRPPWRTGRRDRRRRGPPSHPAAAGSRARPGRRPRAAARMIPETTTRMSIPCSTATEMVRNASRQMIARLKPRTSVRAISTPEYGARARSPRARCSRTA